MRYFFIDQVIEMIPGEKAIGKKNITATEEVFRDHFPGLPIYPGALLIEAMAQLGGLLIEKTIHKKIEKKMLPILITVKKAKFRDVVLPGDTLIITDILDNITDTAAMIDATIMCDGKEKASSQLFYTLLDVQLAFPGVKYPHISEVQNTLERLQEYRKNGLTFG